MIQSTSLLLSPYARTERIYLPTLSLVVNVCLRIGILDWIDRGEVRVTLMGQ